jgi:phage gp37-like protein
MDLISAIEQAIVSRLSVLNTKRMEEALLWDAEKDEHLANGQPVQDSPRPIVLREIAGYGGQLETDEAFAQVYQLAPAFWVTYEGETITQNGSGLVTSVYNFAVIVLAQSYNPDELRLGGPGIPGLYQLITIVKEDLINQNCGLDISPLRLASVAPMWRGGPQGGGFSLALLKFTTETFETYLADPNYDCEEPIFVSEFKVKKLGDIEVGNIIKPWET